MLTKPFDEVVTNDLREYPIWELITESDDFGCLMVKSIKDLPVDDLANRIVATNFILCDGERLFGFLQNVCLTNPKANLHFVQASFALPNEWFTMARYFDPDYARNGPRKLGEILGKPLAAVFPIKYDISTVARGAVEAIYGEITERPRERLSEEEIVRLAVRLTIP